MPDRMPRSARSTPKAWVLVAALVTAGGAGAGRLAGAGAQPEGSAGLAVWVVAQDGGGHGVPGATVEIAAAAPFAAAGPCHPYFWDAAAAPGIRLDGQGGAVLPVERQGVWRVVVRAPAMVPAEVFVAVERGEEAVPGYRFEPDEQDQVRFVDTAGRPLSGVSAVADSGDTRADPRFPWTDPVLRGESGSDGLWRLPLSGRAIWRLGVRMGGYQPWSGDLLGQRLVLQPGAARPLQVLDAQGLPLAAAHLWEAAGCAELGTTDARGEIAVAPALGRQRLVVAAADGRRWSGEPGAPEGKRAAGRPWQWRLPEPLAPISGRLLAAPGGPGVPGAMVWSGEDPAAWTRSDEAGRFQVPRPARGDTVEIHGRAEGFLPFVERRYLGEAGIASPVAKDPVHRGSAVEGLAIVLSPDSPLAGRVLDETGRPVAGAVVAAGSVRTRSGADGSFLLRVIEPDRHHEISAAAAGFAPGEIELTTDTGPPSAGRAPVQLPPISLCRQVPTAVVVRGRSGQPLAGAAVTLGKPGRPGGARSLVTGPDGGFSVPAPLSAELDLAVTASGYVPFEVTWNPHALPGAADPERCQAARELPGIELAGTARLEGTVVDPEGQPLAGAEVWDSPPLHLLATAGPDGRFAADELDLTRGMKACRAGYEAVELRVDESTRRPVTVTLAPATQIEGTVVRQDGSPAANVEVAPTPISLFPGPPARPIAEHCPTERGGSSVRTDSAGHFVSTMLYSQWYRITADDGVEGFAESEPVKPAAGKTVGNVRLTLGPRTSIVGRFRNAAGEPVMGEVRIRRLFASVHSDEEGRFTLAPLHPGDELVEAEAAGPLTVSRLVSLHTGVNEIEMVLPAWPLRRIRGRLVDASGAAAGGVSLQLLGTVYEDQKDVTGTNPDGSFAFDLVPEGEHRLRVGETFAKHRVDPTVLRVAGGDREGLLVRYLAQPEIAVHGRVLDSAGRPGLEVQADGPAPSQTATVAADGSYRLEHLVPGGWLLRARDGDHEGHTVWTDLVAGKPDVTQDLVLAQRQVSGRVVDRRRQPVPDLYVRIEPGGIAAKTGADGTFSHSLPLIEERYSLRLSPQATGEGVDLGDPLEFGRDDLRQVELVYADIAVHGRVLGLLPDEPWVDIKLNDARSTSTEKEGSFSLDGIGPGRWRLQASLPSGESTRREITIRPDASEVAVDLTITRGNLALGGRLIGARDPALFSVEIRREDDTYAKTMQVDSQGAFRFAHLAPGTYFLTAQAETAGETAVAGRQRLVLRGDTSVQLAVDAGVRAIRPPPFEPVD